MSSAVNQMAQSKTWTCGLVSVTFVGYKDMDFSFPETLEPKVGFHPTNISAQTVRVVHPTKDSEGKDVTQVGACRASL